MKRTILVDFNNLAFRCFFIKEVAMTTTSPDYKLWRFMVFDSIYKFSNIEKNINEVIIAVDDTNSWRKSYFSRYKESRKNKRKKVDIDWAELYHNLSSLGADLRHHMPFKVLKIKSAEADDIIAVLAQELYGDNIVISNDEDYLQLCSAHVKIWHPKKKVYVKVDDPEEFVTMKCMTGQAKDDIFNVKTPDDWGKTEETEGKRKPGFGPKAYEKAVDYGLEEWLMTQTDAYGNHDLEKHFHRNQVLMDFNYIPNTIRKRIMQAYKIYNYPPPENIYKFFKKHGMRGYLEEFSMTESKLLKMY